MHALLLVLAAVWGAGTGLLIPRAAYRLSVQPDEPWRTACPGGHPIAGPLGGWLGRARCTEPSGPGPETSHADGEEEGQRDATDADGAVSAASDGMPPGTVSATAPGTVSATAPDAPDATAPDMAATTAPDATGTGPAVTDITNPAGPAGIEPAPSAGIAPAATTSHDPAPTPSHGPAPTAAPRPHPHYGPSTTPVAAATALLCLALAAGTGARPELVVWLLAVPVGVLLALVDHAVHRLPDVLTLPLAAGCAALLGVAALLPGHRGSWPDALLGALVLGAGYFVLCVVYPRGMGLGDAKLALALGAALGWYGWTVLFVGFMAGLILGFCYGVGLMVLRRADRKAGIPFGPYMLGGAFLGLLLGAI
ncbi:prepilin peptidase [Streptomyces sp. TS71-3]|uniref:prepilin peptidase n=1 Tax=Streptomyces sp. TS71-3 TaxID=2733862 RepID=UPI001B267B2D|nr:prepilin peptidase [Streptomyces sp. TS71-3]GHJ35366.1 hypothetical protein Sm713_09750 [Streptomyces sp. TS71-3]